MSSCHFTHFFSSVKIYVGMIKKKKNQKKTSGETFELINFKLKDAAEMLNVSHSFEAEIKKALK